MSDNYAHRRLAELCDDLHPLCPCDLNPETTNGPEPTTTAEENH